MNTVLLFCILLVASLALAIRPTLARSRKFVHVWRALLTAPIPLPFPQRLKIACNSILPEWMGNKTRSFTGDNTITARWMLVKHGGANGAVVACAAAGDVPIGVCIDMYSASDPNAPLTVIPFSGGYGLIPVIVGAGASFVEGAPVYSDGTGKAGVAPTAASAQGNYYRVGQALTGEVNAGGFIALAPCVPVKVSVVTATGAADLAALITALKLTTTAAEVLYK